MPVMENMKEFLHKNALVPPDPKIQLDFKELQKAMEKEPAIKKLIESNLGEKEKTNDYRFN